MRILLCEDDEALAYWLVTRLRDLGHEMAGCPQGDECFKLWLNRRPFHFILSDYNFVPGKQIKNGLDLVRAVHEIDPSQRAIIQTGEPNLIVPPGVGLLHKPYPFHRLVRMMKRMQQIKPLPLFEAR